ncbi:MAG: hypothetical protein K6T94_20375 [Paenibacillus sp.]|nr:hypothetical protein [Paenibacillus sp.]
MEDGKESKISNQKKFEFFLSETDLPLEDPKLKRIPQEEFEQVWDSINKSQRDVWLKLKDSLPLGTKIEGYIEVLYLQGVIVSIPDFDALGIADYAECAANSQKHNMHAGLIIKAEIIGYDEVNNWFLLGNPLVLGLE